jgi:hypothetical protein
MPTTESNRIEAARLQTKQDQKKNDADLAKQKTPARSRYGWSATDQPESKIQEFARQVRSSLQFQES